MKKHAKILVPAAATVLAVGIAVPTLAASGNKYASQSVVMDCGDGDTVALNGPLKLWPPNHKMIDEPVTATDGPSSNPTDSLSNQTTITVTPVITDATGGDGGPQHDPDFYPTDAGGDTVYGSGDPSAVAGVQLRAERSGKGDGRTYTLNWSATFDGGNKSCSSSDSGQSPFVITVPHDMRGGADWKTAPASKP